MFWDQFVTIDEYATPQEWQSIWIVQNESIT